MANIFTKISDVFKKVTGNSSGDTTMSAAVKSGQNTQTPAQQTTTPTPAQQAFKPAGVSMTATNKRTGKTTNINVGQQQTDYATFKNINRDTTSEYTGRSGRDTRPLSERSKENDRRSGIDWSGASQAQLDYLDTYYKTLDDPTHTKMFRDMEWFHDTDLDTSPSSAYKTRYKENRDALDAELKTIKDQYGKNSNEYKALEKFISDYEELYRHTESTKTSQKADKLSGQLDDTIDAVFAGYMSDPGFADKVEKGKTEILGNPKKYGTFTLGMKGASDKQKALLYAVFAEEGEEAAKDFYNRFLKPTVSSLGAAEDYIEGISSDSAFKRAAYIAGGAIGGGLAGDQILNGGIQKGVDAITGKLDAKDTDKLIGDFSVNDSLDAFLKKEFDGIDKTDLNKYGPIGFDKIGTDGASDSWYSEAMEKATDYQKKLLGYIYLASGEDEETAKDFWRSLQGQAAAIKDTVNGGDYSTTNRSGIASSLYQEYLDRSKLATFLYKTAVTTGSMGTQRALALINPIAAGAALGFGVFGNTYAEARAEGKPRARSLGYAASEGFVEGLFETLLGSVSNLAEFSVGGALEKSFVQNISSPYLRAAARLPLNFSEEGSEEYLENLADVVLRNLWFGEKNKFEPLSQENLETFLYAGMASLILGGGEQVMNLRSDINYADIGKALNAQGSTEKLIDTILNNPIEGDKKDASTKLYKEAAELAERIKKGKVKSSDINVGEAYSKYEWAVGQALAKYTEAGGDTSFLTDPDTVSYTKEQITLDDMIAGARSMLTTLDGDVELALDVAKLAMGQPITEEAQAKINASQQAQQVLAQLQGNLDLNVDNALTRAARATTINGALNKVFSTLKSYNPDKHVVSPVVQQLTGSGVKLDEAEKIGAVFNKVLDGQKITKAEAKLVRASSPAIRGVALSSLGVQLSEFADTEKVLSQLNEQAEMNAKTKGAQADIKRTAKAAAEARMANATGGMQNGLRETDTGRPDGVPENGVGTGLQGQVPGAVPKGSGGTPETGRAPASGNRRGQRSGAGAARAQDVQQGVIPSEQLDEGQKRLQEALVSKGFDIVEFVVGQDSGCGWDSVRNAYVCQIRVNGQFGQNQYADHENLHLWLSALKLEAKRALLNSAVDSIFGDDAPKAFSFLYDLYNNKQYFGKKSELERAWQVWEDMLCFAYGGQNFQGKFDFSAYQDAVRNWVEENNLRAIGMGDTSNPSVQQAIKDNRINKDYYERHGYGQTDATEIDISRQAEPRKVKPARTENTQKAIDLANAKTLEGMRKSLYNERHRIVAEAEKNGTTNDPEHRKAVEKLTEQINKIQGRIDLLTGVDRENRQYSADYAPKDAVSFPDSKILKSKTDLNGKPISEDVREFFSQAASIDKDGDVVNDIVQLWLASNYFGYTAYDTSKSDDGISIFLSDNEDVGKSYAFFGNKVVNQVEHAKMLDFIRNRMMQTVEGFDGNLPLIGDIRHRLYSTSNWNTDPHTGEIIGEINREDDAKMLAAMYNFALDYLGSEKPRISSVKNLPKPEDVQAYNDQAADWMYEASRLYTNLKSLHKFLTIWRPYASDKVKNTGASNNFKLAYKETADLWDDFIRPVYDNLRRTKVAIGHAFESPVLQTHLKESEDALNAVQNFKLRNFWPATANESVNRETVMDRLDAIEWGLESCINELKRVISEADNVRLSFNGQDGEVISDADVYDVIPWSASWAVYANTTDMLVIDGSGPFGTPGSWKYIDMSGNKEYMVWAAEQRAKPGSDPDLYNVFTANTRTVAAFAKAKGYKSLVIKNIYDLGGQNTEISSTRPSNIYCVFSPNQIKSIYNEHPTFGDEMQHSADYDAEYYQSIGLIDPDGQTAAFTDNINGVHEEILNQLKGTEGEDAKDFIARGGIRVKPGAGIEVNGNIEPTFNQYEVIDNIVSFFTGKEFSIDFNIDGDSTGSHTFEGMDIDPSRIYNYLRNYYARRKGDILTEYARILGMPVKTMKDAYNIAKFQIQMDEGNSELQQIIDTYENQMRSADYDEDFDARLEHNALVDNKYRNGLWEVSDENPENSLQAEYDALLAELDTFPERADEIWQKMEALQNQNLVRTKNTDDITTEEQNNPQEDRYRQVVDEGTKTEKLKTPAAKAFKKAEEVKPEKKTKTVEEIDRERNRLAQERDKLGSRWAELDTLAHNRALTDQEREEFKQLDQKTDEIQKEIERLFDEREKLRKAATPIAKAEEVKPAEKVEEVKPAEKVEEKKPLKVKPIQKAEEKKPLKVKPVIKPKTVPVTGNGVSENARSEFLKMKAQLEADPSLVEDQAFFAKVAKLYKAMGEEFVSKTEKAENLAAEVEKTEAALASAKAETGQPIVLKDKETKFANKDKGGNWWKNLGRADKIEIRRRRSDRNTFDVRFTDRKGDVITYSEVSPSMLVKAFGFKTGDRETAKTRADNAMALAATPSLEWSSVDNPAVEKVPFVKTEPNRDKDTLGRSVPARLSKYMEKSAVRTADGALINTYRLAPENGVHNAKVPGRITMFSERPAAMNILRGMNGAEAYSQPDKSAGERLSELFGRLADPKTTTDEVAKIRKEIGQIEKENAKYFSGITRLDPYRPKFQFATQNNIVNGKSLLEAYLDIRKPLVIDAKGQGLDFVQEETRKYVNDPDNKAFEFDSNKDPIGPHDGLKFENVKITSEGETLGGGELDNDTVYVTFRNNQAKSTYNAEPTDSDLIQYSADDDFETGFTEGSLEDTILKILMDKDEDRATAALAEYVSRFMQTGVLPEIETEKARNIFNPKVTPAQAKIIEDRIQEYVNKYGALEKGENPARDVVFPRRTDGGNTQRTFRNAAESPNTPEWAMDALKREFVLSEGTYEPATDKAAIAFANREMQRKGYDKLLAEWQGKIDANETPTKNDVAIGSLLFNEAVKARDMETAMRTLVELADVGTTAGQTVQAFRLLKKMPKSYQLYYFQRVANRLNRTYSKRINSGKMTEIKLDTKLSRAVLQAKTEEELNKAIDALIQNIADQIPATLADKWNAWRYLAMLGNFRTHFRNYLGNALFAPAKFAKDLVAAGLETTFIKDPNERVTSFKGLLDRKGTKEYRDFALKDFEGIKDDLRHGGKMNPTNAVLEKRTIFDKIPWLEKLRRLNGNALEGEDALFLKRHYVNALTNFLATKGMSVEDLQGTKEGAKILNAARQYAINEAQKATYRDASAVATALNQLKRVPGLGLLVEGLVPFTKTPINILKRGIEYSPIGLLNATTLQLAKLKNGEISANEFVDKLASGLTGTGITILGLWLSSLGLLRGGDDDDEKEQDFAELLGYQNYSINIGGTNYTIDWMAPSALPLFVGAALFDEMKEKNGLTGADLYNAMTVITEPITQLSMLSGLNDALKSAKWDDNPTASVIQSMGAGYLSQGIPTFLAQLARSTTADRRTTYVDKNSDVPQPIQRWVQTNVLGKTANWMRPNYIDAWGRKDTTQSFLVRLFDNMLSPGYRNKVNETPVDKELQRLAKATGTSVLMSPAERSIEFDNQKHNLTADQYQTYATVRGQQTFTMLNTLINSEVYQGMSDAEKAKAVQAIKDYGNVLGKQAVFPEYDPTTDNWAQKCDGDPTRLTNMVLLKAQASDQDIKVGNNSNFYKMVINSDWLSTTDKAYAMAQQYVTSSKTVYEHRGGKEYELTKERKEILYKHVRDIYPAYYAELTSTKQWKNAGNSKRLKLLESMRKEIGDDAKAWLAKQLRKEGAKK